VNGCVSYAESGGFTQEGIEEVLGPLIAETPDAAPLATGGQ
jgi:hypothetical protein